MTSKFCVRNAALGLKKKKKKKFAQNVDVPLTPGGFRTFGDGGTRRRDGRDTNTRSFKGEAER